jgi:hypothetical protein
MRQYSLVRVKEEDEGVYTDHFFPDTKFVFLGEIPNMLGHCVIIGQSTRKTYIGFHIEVFEEIPEDEV